LPLTKLCTNRIQHPTKVTISTSKTFITPEGSRRKTF
jgi:hypothetical protein